MKALFKTMMYAGIAGSILTGCMNDDLYDPEAAQKRYQANWEKTLGDIDPNQTWNTAATRTANVTVGYAGNYTVKFYTGNPRYADEQAYLLGEFDVQGGKTSSLQFDAPSCLQYVYVGLIDEEGHRIIKSARLDDGMAKVTFGGASTRTIYEGDDNVVTVTKGDFYEYGQAQCDIPLQTLPEGKANLSKVTQNFFYKSTGEFTIYPFYYNTGNWSMDLGIYYYDGEKTEENLRTVKIWNRDNSIRYHFKNEWGVTSFRDGNALVSEALKYDGLEKLSCQGIKVNIPVGTEFGFYVTNGMNLYSQKSLNTGNFCYGATFHNQGTLYLSFEDWPCKAGYDQSNPTSGDSDCDFNDLVCFISGATPSNEPEIVDEDSEDTPMTYIIACEDLGGTDDFDFNDIVLGIQHTSGQTKAYATLMAAGGSLPAKVTYKESAQAEQVLFNEVHEAFGVSTETLVNTGKDVTLPYVHSNAFTVGADFSVATHAQYFNIIVTNREGNVNTSISVPKKEGATPQAFLIADPKWEWPTERQSITKKYSDFQTWSADYSADNWYNAVWGTVPPKNEGEGGGGTTTPAGTSLSFEYIKDYYEGNVYRVSGDPSLFTIGKKISFTGAGSFLDISYDEQINNKISWSSIQLPGGDYNITDESVVNKLKEQGGIFYVACWQNGTLTSVTIQ